MGGVNNVRILDCINSYIDYNHSWNSKYQDDDKIKSIRGTGPLIDFIYSELNLVAYIILLLQSILYVYPFVLSHHFPKLILNQRSE